MGWTSGGEDLGYTGGIWDDDGHGSGGSDHGGGGSMPFGSGMDTAFGGGGGSGGSSGSNPFSSFFTAQNMQPIVAGLGQLGSSLQNNAMLQQYSRSMSGPLPQAELGALNMDQVGAAMARAEQMSRELSSLTPNELTLRSAANASARGAGAHGVTGALAGSMQQDSENQATSLWDQWRRQMLLQSNQQSSDLAVQRQRLLEQNWQRYLAQRRMQAAAEASMMKGSGDIAGAIAGGVGALGFGIAGGNPMQGYQLGNAFGQGVMGVQDSGSAPREHYSSSYDPARGY